METDIMTARIIALLLNQIHPISPLQTFQAPWRASSQGHGKWLPESRTNPSSREQSAGCMSWCPRCSLLCLAARLDQHTALQWITESCQSGKRDVWHECGHCSNCQIKKTNLRNNSIFRQWRTTFSSKLTKQMAPAFAKATLIISPGQ